MKLYRAKVPVIAEEVIRTLVEHKDIEVTDHKEAEADLVAIMEEFLRRDAAVRKKAKDVMARRKLPYAEYGRIRKAVADEMDHPTYNDVQKFLNRQFIENLMISRFVDEVWSEDAVLRKKIAEVLERHDVDEQAIREEAAGKVKNVKEGTVEYEIALNDAIREVKRRRGLFGEDKAR
jgi:uncharacterized protein